MAVAIRLYRFQFKLIPILLTLVVIAVCAKLGFWQLQRGEDKQNRLLQIEKYQQLDKITFAKLLELQKLHDPTGIIVQFQGEFLAPYRWLLDNRVVKGQTGYDVLLAMHMAGFEQAVLVNMGWIKADYATRDILPQFDIPSGTVTIEAYVKAKDIASFVLSEQSSNQQQWPQRIQQVNFDAIESQTKVDFFDFVLYAQQQPDYGFVHHYQPVVMPPEKHQAYALQWFLLALAALVIFIFASIENKRRGEQQ